MEWTLTPVELELTRDKIRKVNERAIKKGFTGRLDVVAERHESTRNVAGFEVTEVVYKTRISGEAPCYNGWTFLAALDSTEAGFIVRTAPGVESIDRTTLEPGKCDHCGINRYRKNSYVISDGTQQLQVGSSCIKDFLGWDVIPAFVSESDVEETLSGFCGSGPREFTIESVLAVAWACVTQFGFVRSMEPGSTRDAVSDVLDPFNKASRELAEQIRPLAEQAKPMAHKLREFILSDEFSGTSEYVQNLKVLCEGDTVTHRHMGLLVSAPQAYAKHQERSFIREREKSEIVNEWMGREKEKLTLNVRIKAVRFIDGPYGCTTLYTMLSDTGYTFKWFSSKGAFGDDTTEQFFSIVGTVKKHEEYNSYKSTVLTRCKKN